MSFVPLKNLISQITKSTAPPIPEETPHYTSTSLVNTKQGVFELFKTIIKDVCGDVVSMRIQPLYINNNALVIICLSQAAGDILRLKERDIIDKVNAGSRGTTIKQLSRVG